MSSQQPVIMQNPALEPATQKPFPAGANSINTAGIVSMNNAAKSQTALIGGIKRLHKMRNSKGGAAQVLVSAAPSYAVNQSDTNDANKQLAELALSTQNNASFDNTVNGNQADVSIIAAKSQATYNGKGGRTRSSAKKGGSFSGWGCFSGGKKSRTQRRQRRQRRHKKSCKCKSRKTCKHTKRHRR